MNVLEVEALRKTFRVGFSRRRVEAIKGIEIIVERGSVVAFVGPNGAGKTTTLMMILGLLKPDAGRIAVFGEPASSLVAKRRLGFQSEIFFTYPFHTARRALRFYGRLSGMTTGALASRVDPLLERVGLAHAADRRVATFSKGMMQRLGLAQALIHEPDLLLLDEPTTGLDPEGRKLVADIIRAEKSHGRTVFLSSHILTDVERSCDRVVMIRSGEIAFAKELTRDPEAELWEIELSGEVTTAEEVAEAVDRWQMERSDGKFVYRCSASEKAELLRRAAAAGFDVFGVRRVTETLEDLYMEHVGGTSDG